MKRLCVLESGLGASEARCDVVVHDDGDCYTRGHDRVREDST
jgi:hypothetical protein